MLGRYYDYLQHAAANSQLLDFPSGGGQPTLASNMGVANGIFVSPRLIAIDQQKNDTPRGVLRSFTFDGAKLDAMERAELFVALVAQFNQELLKFVDDWTKADKFVQDNAKHSEKTSDEEKWQDTFAGNTFSVTRKALGDSAKFIVRIHDALVAMTNAEHAPGWMTVVGGKIVNINPDKLLETVSSSLNPTYAKVRDAAATLQTQLQTIDDLLKEAITVFFGPATSDGDTVLTAELTAMKLWYHPAVHTLNVELVKLWSGVPVHVCSYHTLWLALANQLLARKQSLGDLKNFMTTESQQTLDLEPARSSGALSLASSATAGSAVNPASAPKWDTYRRIRNLTGTFEKAWEKTKELVTAYEQRISSLEPEERAVLRDLVAKWKHSPLRRLVVAWEDYIGSQMPVIGTVPTLLQEARKYPTKQPKDNKNHLRAGPTINMLRAALPDMPVEISVMLDVAQQASIAVDDIYIAKEASRY